MRHQDFGRFDGPLVLFGGAYSNLQATEAFFKEAGSREVICTGDIVAYCADPVDTAALVALEDCWGCIAGNCERQIVEDADDCGCGFEEGTACDLLSAGWYPDLRQKITETEKNIFASLPEIGSFVANGRRYAVIHGGATEINKFIWPSSPQSVFEEEIDALERMIGPIDGVVAGHCGIAFHRMVADKQWINAGAIGMPPHDGRPETRYAVLEDGDVTIHRLTYDHDTARARMEASGLTQGYHHTLSTGIWPSEDVLPTELRR